MRYESGICNEITVQRSSSIMDVRVANQTTKVWWQSMLDLNTERTSVDLDELRAAYSIFGSLQCGDRFGSYVIVARRPSEIAFMDMSRSDPFLVWIGAKVLVPQQQRRPIDEFCESPHTVSSTRSAALFDPTRQARLKAMLPSVDLSIVMLKFSTPNDFDDWFKSSESHCEILREDLRRSAIDRFISQCTVWPCPPENPWLQMKSSVSFFRQRILEAVNGGPISTTLTRYLGMQQSHPRKPKNADP